MPPYRTFGWSRGAGLRARSCPSVVLLSAGAEGELPRPPARKIEGLVAWCATDLLRLPTQAKTRRAPQAWRDIRPRAAKAGLFPSQAAEPLRVLAANSPICARSARGTRKPHAGYPDRAGGSPRRPRTRAQSRPTAPKPQTRPAYLPTGCHCPNRNGDRCAPGTSRRSASTFRWRELSRALVSPRVPSRSPEPGFRENYPFAEAAAIRPPD